MEAYTVDDTTKIQFVGYEESAERVSCPSNLLVTAPQCYDNYMNADVYRKRGNPCFQCKVGHRRRLDMAMGVFDGAPLPLDLIEIEKETNYREASQAARVSTRATPNTLANAQRRPLFEILREVIPGLTGEQLREWIYKGWPPDAKLRVVIAEALHTTADKVKWGGTRST